MSLNIVKVGGANRKCTALLIYFFKLPKIPLKIKLREKIVEL